MTISIKYLTEQGRKYDSMTEALFADAVEAAGIYVEDYKMRPIASALCDCFCFYPKTPLPAQVQELLDAQGKVAAPDCRNSDLPL